MDMIKDLKKSAISKFSQGDVNVYVLKEKPTLTTTKYLDNILVEGSGGNKHKLVGRNFTVGKTNGGQFIIEVTGKGVSLAHAQHKPPIQLPVGYLLVDRAVEKGMFNDMIAPVAD